MRRLLIVGLILGLMTAQGCGGRAVLKNLPADPKAERWEEYRDFLRNGIPEIYKSGDKYIAEKGLSAFDTNPTVMRDNAIANCRKHLRGAILSNIGSYAEIYDRVFHNYDIAIGMGSSNSLKEAIAEEVIDGAVHFNREIDERDFTDIGKGYWVVRYISVEDVRLAEAEVALKHADLVTEKQRDAFRARAKQRLGEARKRQKEALSSSR